MSTLENSRSKTSNVVAIFGATGTAGMGAVRAALFDSRVSDVRAITRRPLGISDPKLREVLCSDFSDLTAIAEDLASVDGCLFCLGASVRNVKGEARYREIHVGYALAAARMLLWQSPEASFVYLSGAGTNRRSRMMWARVKAEAEDQLAQLGLARLVCVRPRAILPIEPTGAERWLLRPLLRLLPFMGMGAEELGRAMLQAGLNRNAGHDRLTLEHHALKERAQDR